jgi:hypothetical protein
MTQTIKTKKLVPLHQSPTLLIGVLSLALVTGFSFWQDSTKQGLWTQFGCDDSESRQNALPDLCDRVKTSLEESVGDKGWKTRVVFADRVEILEDRALTETMALPFMPKPKKEANEIGKLPGTSVNGLFQVLNAINSAKYDIPRPAKRFIAIVVHKDEPGLDGKPTDFKKLSSQIEDLTNRGAIVRFVGPTGELADTLRNAMIDNPKAQICTLSGFESCLKEGIALARDSK